MRKRSSEKLTVSRLIRKEARKRWVTVLVNGRGGNSGSVIDSHGNVLTALHVISVSHPITVKDVQGILWDATVLGIDKEKDIAVLATGIRGHHNLRVHHARCGERVFYVGNRNSRRGLFSQGRVLEADRDGHVVSNTSVGNDMSGSVLYGLNTYRGKQKLIIIGVQVAGEEKPRRAHAVHGSAIRKLLREVISRRS